MRRPPCFLAHFDAKQCKNSFQQPHSSDPSSFLCSIAFQSRYICSLLLDLDPYGGNYPDGIFPLFYEHVTRELAPKFSVIFRHLLGSRCCPRVKRISLLEIGDYRHISITPLLSKVFEKIVAGKLRYFLESNSLLPPSLLSYHRGLETCDVLLTLYHHLKVALDRDMERKLDHLDFSSALDRVSHCGLLHKLRSIGVGGQLLYTVSEFLSDIRQHNHLDGKIGASVDVAFGAPQGSLRVLSSRVDVVFGVSFGFAG